MRIARLSTAVGTMLTTAGLAALFFRMIPASSFYEDLENAWPEQTVQSEEHPLFERVVELPPDKENVSMFWQVPNGATELSFYPLECAGSMEEAQMDVFSLSDNDSLSSISLRGNLPQYVEVPLPPGTRELRVSISRPRSASHEKGVLTFGYLLWRVP